MTTEDIKLSICIPTYNRSAFLRRALQYYSESMDLPFAYEIVISDNASTDDTSALVDEFIGRGLPIRYFRRATNGGLEVNVMSAFHLVRGSYAVYVGDDDRLIADGLREVVDYLDANPVVSACYAPWYQHNEIEGRDTHQFFELERDVRFARRSYSEVFDFVTERHIFPEAAVFRVSALRSLPVPGLFCYSPFMHLAHFLDHGDVAFLRKPFYRAIIQSEIVRDRVQAGHDEAMTSWDRYRGGLEYFLHTGLKRGAMTLSGERGARYQKVIQDFVFVRMSMALKLWLGRKNYLKAHEIYVRLAANGFAGTPDLLPLRDVLPRMAALQALAWTAGAVAGVSRLVLHGIGNIEPVERMLRDLGLPQDVSVLDRMESDDMAEIAGTLVLVPGEAERQQFLDRGYLQNLVLRETDLSGSILV
jgi:hypothetical protein